jgi:hypothetical protein
MVVFPVILRARFADLGLVLNGLVRNGLVSNDLVSSDLVLNDLVLNDLVVCNGSAGVSATESVSFRSPAVCNLTLIMARTQR